MIKYRVPDALLSMLPEAVSSMPVGAIVSLVSTKGGSISFTIVLSAWKYTPESREHQLWVVPCASSNSRCAILTHEPDLLKFVGRWEKCEEKVEVVDAQG